MTTDDFLAKIKALPRGAVFHRCALQVNPAHYQKTFRGQQVTSDPLSHARDILEKASDLEISVLAITDHNDVSGVPIFQEAARDLDSAITILPGFELTSSEGIQLLCIYPPDFDQDTLGRCLGEFGIREPKPSSTLSSRPFGQILEIVQEQGGVTIAAHITQAKGLFEVLKGRARINAWKDDHLLAIQIPSNIEKLQDDIRPIVENKNIDYKRTAEAGVKQAIACINARDVVTKDDLKLNSSTCLIKMSKVTVEGLRQAFLDPESRIRLANDTGDKEHFELIALHWEGGFLDQSAIRFNPGLNVLIGGRGAGKSTVIESIRYVMGLEPKGEDAERCHKGIVRHVLKNGTKLILQVCSYRPMRQDYLIERTIPNPPLVRDSDGKISNLLPLDILPNIELYGQHEISELAKNHERRTRLLDRFVEQKSSLIQDKIDAKHCLGKTRKSFLDTEEELQRLEERLATLPGLEETLKRFQDSGLEERLREKSSLVREEQIFESIPSRLQPFNECLDVFEQDLPIDRAFLSPAALDGLPNKEILLEMHSVLDCLSSELKLRGNQLAEAIRQAEDQIAGIRSRWKLRQDKATLTYQQTLRELQQAAVDGEEFIRLRGEIEKLRPLRERQSQLQRIKKEHLTERRVQLAEWEDLKACEIRALSRAAEEVSRQLRGRVRITVSASGDREPLFELLREQVGGRLSEAIEALKRAKDFSLTQFVDICRNRPDELQLLYHIPNAQSKRLADLSERVLMSIEELELPPTTEIRLNTSPSGEPPSWHALEALSTGQKATAILLLLLLTSDAPLIIDQPEDDLDNRFITEGIVPRMRAEKRRRQFVFSTHNANIPVLGDSELTIGLTASGEAADGKAHIAPEHMGSIDEQDVRELIEEILEGGKEAFERRRRKYGF